MESKLTLTDEEKEYIANDVLVVKEVVKTMFNALFREITKDPLNLHSFVYESLLKKKEISHELSGHALLNNLNREEVIMNNFKVGEYIVYVNGSSYEIGRIKSLREDGAFVYYHEGDTASKTPYECMHKLTNGYCVKKTTLGGEKC